jgi:hypothetical protein
MDPMTAMTLRGKSAGIGVHLPIVVDYKWR